MADFLAVHLELVKTTRNVFTEHEIPFGNSTRENGPTFLDFPLFLGIFQWEEPTKRVSFTAKPEIPEILTKWKTPIISGQSSPLVRSHRKFPFHFQKFSFPVALHLVTTVKMADGSDVSVYECSVCKLQTQDLSFLFSAS